MSPRRSRGVRGRTRPALLLAALAAALSTSCGSGGSSSTTCSIPGVLRALAVQGQAAPDTTGNFGAMPTTTIMDTALNGWSVFVAPTTDAAAPSVLYVAQPDASLLRVFAVGDVAPAPLTGMISGFVNDGVEVSGDGHMVAQVTITGDASGATFAILAAHVTSGVAAGKVTVVYDGEDLTGVGVAGNVATLLAQGTALAEDGHVFFRTTTTSGVEGLVRSDADGTNLVPCAVTGDALSGGKSVNTFLQTAISSDGAYFAVACDTLPGSVIAIITGTPGAAGLATLALDGDPIDPAIGGGSLLDAYVDGPLIVYTSGTVVWKARGNKTLPDDLIMAGHQGLAFETFARGGHFAPSAGGSLYGTFDLLNNEAGASPPIFSTVLSGAPNAGLLAFYAFLNPTPALAMWQTRSAPPADGGTFSGVFPGLGLPGHVEVTQNGSFVFANLLSNGKSGIFWLIPSCGLFTVAISGNPVLASDQFLAFSPSSGHTASNDTLLFRAALATAGSGIFRQGP